MALRFYPLQTDYIYQLNAMDGDLQSVLSSAGRTRLWVQDRYAVGSSGATYASPGVTAGAPWFIPLSINTIVRNTISGAALNVAKNGIFLLAGTYRFTAQLTSSASQNCQCRLYNTTNSTEIAVSVNQNSNGGPGAATGIPMSLDGEFVLAADSTVQFQRYAVDVVPTTNVATGIPANQFAEIYLNAVFEKVS